MADTETAAEVLREIVTNLGGTGEEQTIVPLLIELRDLLGEGGITGAVDAWMDENGSEVIIGYLTEQGVEVSYSVTDGDLSVVLT